MAYYIIGLVCKSMMYTQAWHSAPPIRSLHKLANVGEFNTFGDEFDCL